MGYDRSLDIKPLLTDSEEDKAAYAAFLNKIQEECPNDGQRLRETRLPRIQRWRAPKAPPRWDKAHELLIQDQRQLVQRSRAVHRPSGYKDSPASRLLSTYELATQLLVY